MPIRFSDLLADEAFGVRNRRDIREFYDAVKDAVAEGSVNLEGHSLPTTLNAWIARVEGDGKMLKRDTDTVDFSLADDEALASWRERWLAARTPKPKTVYTSASAHALFERVKALEEVNRASLAATNGKKDDLLSALSDMQAAAALLLQCYDRVRTPLKLPDRELPLSAVKPRQRPKRERGGATSGKTTKSSARRSESENGDVEKAERG